MKEIRKIALIGFGLEAKSAYEFLKNQYPNAIFDIYDQNKTSKVALPDGVDFCGGVSDFSQIEADLIVRTPAVRPDRLPANVETTSVTNLFFEHCPAKIIGVTGTKGKGTTSSLIASILRARGHKTHLVGNIGVPALDVLPEISADDAVVFEMSSFQLWDLKKSPSVSVVLMIEPDHLDVHTDFEEYIASKSQVRAHQTLSDFCIFNSENEFSKKIALDSGAKNPENTLCYGADIANNCFVQEGKFFVRSGETLREICPTSYVKLPGAHNLQNACAAILAALSFDSEISNEEISAGLGGFTGLPHRLKFVREIDGVDFYDDSISTTPGSAIAAIRAFERPKVLLLGGSDKGADLTPLFDEILASKSIRKVLIYGAQSPKLAEEFVRRDFSDFENLGQKPLFKKVVQRAHEVAQSGDVVVLSPAHASFDMFASYADRGGQFVEAVENLQ